VVLLRCADCQYEAGEDEFVPARDVWERNSLGDAFSDLECPECGALAFPVDAASEDADGPRVHDALVELARIARSMVQAVPGELATYQAEMRPLVAALETERAREVDQHRPAHRRGVGRGASGLSRDVAP
jgi:hypothetical protein